ncbi:MAG: ATP-binding protein [Candidatus Binatia bacterium]
MREHDRSVLHSRATAVCWTILAGVCLFSIAKAWFEPATGYLWYGPAAALAVLQVGILGRLRRGISARNMERTMLADTSAACAVVGWLGMVSGRTTGSDFFLVGLAVNTAAVLPWGPQRQALLALAAGAAIFANGYGVNGSLASAVDFRTFVPVLVLLGASVFTTRLIEAARYQGARSELLRRRAEAEILEANSLLERRVAERTAELEAANGELEAFSYSVSHDLRAPLRAMDGFSEALLEDYTDQLDKLGKDYLRRIRGEARRLGELVDDLLRLSRVTRAVVRRQNVDITELALVEADRLLKANPEREVSIKVAPGLKAHCDEYLVRIALQNLLGNAFKFTQHNAQPRVELGRERRNGDEVFVLRDNGVGFDMAHVGKIFEAFQRLHSEEEFDGTGIGLTTVERIVRRHGGRITAEGEPDRGATFRFTLAPAGGENG